MLDARGVAVVVLRKRELEHDRLLNWQGVELLEEGPFERLFSLGLVRAVNVHFRLDDRHEASGADLRSDVELLAHNVLDAGGIGVLDDRAHLGAEDALRCGFGEQRRQRGHELHQLDPLLLRGQALIHFQKRPHPFHIPTQIAETAVCIRWGEGVAFMDDSTDSPRSAAPRYPGPWCSRTEWRPESARPDSWGGG